MAKELKQIKERNEQTLAQFANVSATLPCEVVLDGGHILKPESALVVVYNFSY